MFGNPETTPGGTALKFYSSVRLDIRRIASIKVGDRILGSRTRVRVMKNKVAPPFKNAEFDIIYGEGIYKLSELIDLGVAQNVVDKSGTWFSYKNERLGQGRDNAAKFLEENRDMAQEIERTLRGKLGLIKEKEEEKEKEPAKK